MTNKLSQIFAACPGGGNFNLQGGTIRGENAAELKIFSSTFTANTATNGGAIYAQNNIQITIRDTTFETNTAGGAVEGLGGGVIYAESGVILKIFSSAFTSNNANQVSILTRDVSAMWGGTNWNYFRVGLSRFMACFVRQFLWLSRTPSSKATELLIM